MEKRASPRSRSRRRRRLGWLLSRERNCGCLSNPTDRNSISSCVSHLPRCVSLLIHHRDIALSHSLSPSLRSSRSKAILRCFFSLTLIYFIRAISTVYATYPRPPIGPQLTEISCGAPGRAAVRTPSYPHIRQPSNTPSREWLSASHSYSLLAIGPRLSEDGLRHLNARDVPFPAGCCLPLIRAFLTPTSRQVSFMIRIASLRI